MRQRVQVTTQKRRCNIKPRQEKVYDDALALKLRVGIKSFEVQADRVARLGFCVRRRTLRVRATPTLADDPVREKSSGEAVLTRNASLRRD